MNTSFSPPDKFQHPSRIEQRKHTPDLIRKKHFERAKLLFPSPLDRIRHGINERAASFGLRKCLDQSFELNQSFPRRVQRRLNLQHEIDLEKTTSPKHSLSLLQLLSLQNTPSPNVYKSNSENNMEKLRVDGANGLRFSARRVRGCFTPGTGSPYNSSFNYSTSDSVLRIPKSGINPNKAVFTIDSKSSQILIVNNNACQLLGYTSKELCSMQFSNLLLSKKKSHVSALAEGQLNSEDGTMVLLSGKVVEMNTKMGNKVAVSLWIRQIDNEGRCLAVAEPVERRVAEVLIDQSGIILNGDYEALILFQLESEDKLCGLEVTTLIPAIQLPNPNESTLAKNIRKQKATGKTYDGVSFPLCLMVSEFEYDNLENKNETFESINFVAGNRYYIITIWVFTNLSGLIVIDENGIIESCNHHFSMLMFGFSETKILGQLITKIIPNFGQEFQYIGYRSRNATISSVDDDESETETDPVCLVNDIDINESNTSLQPLHPPIVSSSYPNIPTFPSPPIINSQNVQIAQTPPVAHPPLLSSQSTAITTPLSISTPKMTHSLDFTQPPHNLLQSTANKNILNKNPLSAPILASTNPFLEHLNEELENDRNLGNCAVKDVPLNDEIELLTPVNELSNGVGTMDYSRQDSIGGLGDGGGCLTPMMMNKIPSGGIIDDSSITSPYLSSGIGGQMMNTSLSKKTYIDGNYKGEAIHNDGNIIDIIYTISCQTLPCGRKVFCVWICRDPDSEDYDEFDDEDERHQNLTLTFNSGNSQIDNSLGQQIKQTAAAQNSSRPNSLSLVSQCEEEQISGEFAEHYTTLKQIGKGAYGYVKMAYRNSDRLLVIAKFILKEKLCSQFMILTDDNKEVPMEIYLLSTVQHPNVVQVFDVFENEKFFQLVMEKHGSGMDLFEFIDRRPLMDEKLACFIFRQIANAVDYLHSLNILHRDIKDENIIIDHNFHVKLIDFGSATFMQEGKLFSTFFGTTEYCSPEVLAGNKYAGPELEMWSLGVTLYVLIFFENPFLDIEETLRGELRIPHHITPNLSLLLMSMLDKNPKTRCTMKQLIENPWLNQEISPNCFNFINIVRCEAYESNPDKYYTGQKFSSTTGLSTTSPQDSLSLVDDDSIIDVEDEDDDDKSIPSQDHDSGFKLESLPSVGYSESIGSVSISSSSHVINYDLTNENLSQSNSGNTFNLNLSQNNSISCHDNYPNPKVIVTPQQQQQQQTSQSSQLSQSQQSHNSFTNNKMKFIKNKNTTTKSSLSGNDTADSNFDNDDDDNECIVFTAASSSSSSGNRAPTKLIHKIAAATVSHSVVNSENNVVALSKTEPNNLSPSYIDLKDLDLSYDGETPTTKSLNVSFDCHTNRNDSLSDSDNDGDDDDVKIVKLVDKSIIINNSLSDTNIIESVNNFQETNLMRTKKFIAIESPKKFAHLSKHNAAHYGATTRLNTVINLNEMQSMAGSEDATKTTTTVTNTTKFLGNLNSSSQSTASATTGNIVPSKSETNIFEGSLSGGVGGVGCGGGGSSGGSGGGGGGSSNKTNKMNKFNIYDVVSLNDLANEDMFSSSSPQMMVDLSKTQILNKISDDNFVIDKNNL